jgi:hypothetical protein
MGWPDHPKGLGGGSATPKGQKKKRKKDRAMGLGFWGWLDHPQGPGGGFGHPLPAVGGGQSHAQALEGWSGHPQRPNPFFPFFFFFWPFGVAGPPPKAWGWPKPPPYGRYGVAGHPDFFPLLFFLIFFLFLNPKKKKIKKILKCSKLRRFGQSQNGVVLERRVSWAYIYIYLFIYPLYP